MPGRLFTKPLNTSLHATLAAVRAAREARLLTALKPIATRLDAFMVRRAGAFRRRIQERRLVDGHGDLRPEHVYLRDMPRIIDCLEFNREFRLVDPLEELAFLWMECTRLGAPNWGELFLRVYLKEVGDDAPDELMWFYMASRACLRAKLALGHLLDGEVRDPRRWLDQADQYLDLANRYAARL